MPEVTTVVASKPNGFPTERRLRSRAAFEQAFTRGRSWSHPLIGLRVHADGQCRVGFAVGKRLGGAVVRNRVKRRLRDVARQLAFQPGLDFVIVARAPAVSATYAEIRDAVIQVLGRAKALAIQKS
ncbi:MAG: ribonuclease P protein component [Dehalococcoidia bacterium]|nr:ribonuclease P protein component [Dehalococcoidia bacterium]